MGSKNNNMDKNMFTIKVPEIGVDANMIISNRPDQNLHLARQTGGTEEHSNLDGCSTERNRIKDHIAVSYTQAQHNDSNGLNSYPMDFSLMKNATNIAPSNRNLNLSISMAARRPMLPKFHPESSSDERNSYSALDRVYKDVNTPLIPNRTKFSGSNSDNLLNNDIHSSDSNPLEGIFSDKLHEAGAAPSFINSSQSILETMDQLKCVDNQLCTMPEYYDGLLEHIVYSATTAISTPNGVQKNSDSNICGNESLGVNLNKTPKKAETMDQLKCADSQLYEIQDYYDGLLQQIVYSAAAAKSTPNGVQKGSYSNICGSESSLGFDLNKTPEHKAPKQRKHRPKVIVEGKPRSQIPANQKTEFKENPTRKRKYVRNVPKTAETSLAVVTKETSDFSAASRKSSRKALNFESEIGNVLFQSETCFENPQKAKEQNALVPYKGHGSIVPYEGFEFAEKGKQIPKVDVDPETKRIWKMLMANEGSEGLEGIDSEKEKWWEEERKVFHERADSFIARMHLLQGDRRFSKWKGSVVDSVIGVFLTQNVSDHLSSSAFMSLAAMFPLMSTSSKRSESAYQKTLQQEGTPFPESVSTYQILGRRQDDLVNDSPNIAKYANKGSVAEKMVFAANRPVYSDNSKPETQPKIQVYSSGPTNKGSKLKVSKARKVKPETNKKNACDWDELRKQVLENGTKKQRNIDTMDSMDYEALRCASVDEISEAIKERGFNKMLAERIKEFLNKLVEKIGSIDLEWLRDAPPDKAKDLLLKIYGLGLKSAECVRLLTLHHHAFPVDTNVGRIAVRLGWVPLQPLPDSLHLHLLQLYPVEDSIQKYLWPRLCKLDQRTLYELHYQMITFGKVFCTKKEPNCNACPMRAECRHFASAFASKRLALPGTEEKEIASASVPIASERNCAVNMNPMIQPLPENELIKEANLDKRKCEPIIEEPATPEPECPEALESDIEDSYREDPDELPTIKLQSTEVSSTNVRNNIQEYEKPEGDMSMALVELHPKSASMPPLKLKYVSRLRTEHRVYELPDSHPLLEKMDKREHDDPSPYLLAIWRPGETADSTKPPKSCGTQDSTNLCNDKTCFSCNSVREAKSQTVRGTLLIPCRTATRGSFPLNGTYFQVNEVFADYSSSIQPLDVPREWIWNLTQRTVYFGASVSSIFKGMSTQEIQHCFWRVKKTWTREPEYRRKNAKSGKYHREKHENHATQGEGDENVGEMAKSDDDED